MTKQRETKTVVIFTECECGERLQSLHEAIRGVCHKCWFKSLSTDKQSSFDNIIGSIINKEPKEKTQKYIDDCIELCKKDFEDFNYSIKDS
jgi:hypothetical protein